MKERPILFSGPMVRALLAGTKTQTRRAVTNPHRNDDGFVLNDYGKGWWPYRSHDGESGCYLDRQKDGDYYSEAPLRCPYGKPYDRLWVRENGWERPERTPKMMREGADTWAPYYYDADGLLDCEVEDFKAWGFKRRPSIHMPRWASRITLEVTGVRVERLQDISEADSIAEGLTCKNGLYATPGEVWQIDPRKAYRDLWEQINGTGSWDANPWVWVVEFRRLP